MKHKLSIGFITTAIFRLLKVFSNADPIMGFALTESKKGHPARAFAFPFLNIILIDFLMGFLGVWTIVTSVTYGLIGAVFVPIVRNKKSSLVLYLSMSTVGVLAYDFITGVVMSSVMFSQPFIVSLMGQIPFTLMHVFSAGLMCCVIVPFYDPAVMLEVKEYLSAIKQVIVSGVTIWQK